MSLEQSINQKTKQANKNAKIGGAGADENAPSFKVNPDIDQKIDQYIKDNPKRVKYLESLPKERLIRKVVLSDALKHDLAQTRILKENTAIEKFLKENPAIAKDIEKRIAAVPDEQKQSARMNLGKREATNKVLKIT